MCCLLFQDSLGIPSLIPLQMHYAEQKKQTQAISVSVSILILPCLNVKGGYLLPRHSTLIFWEGVRPNQRHCLCFNSVLCAYLWWFCQCTIGTVIVWSVSFLTCVICFDLTSQPVFKGAEEVRLRFYRGINISPVSFCCGCGYLFHPVKPFILLNIR